MDDRTRRQVLGSAGVVAAGTASSGCLGAFGLGSGGSGDDHGELFERAPLYRWLPASDVLGVDHYGFQAYSAGAVRAGSDAVGDRVVGRYLRSAAANSPRELDLGAPDVDYTAVVTPVAPGAGTPFVAHVVEGSFGTGAVRSPSSEQGFQRSGSYGDYQVHRLVSGGRTTVAVSEGTAVVARNAPGERRRELVEAFVDAEAGDAARFVAGDDDFEAVAEALGGGFRFSGGTNRRVPDGSRSDGSGALPGQVASGGRVGSDGGALQSQVVIVFDSSDSFDRTAVDSYLADSELIAPMGPTPTVSTDGRVVTATQDLSSTTGW
jgi:hypothetical protein